MSIPKIFKHLGLANDDDVWLVEMALYGLTTSPKDWSIHRDDTLAKLTWKRSLDDGDVVTGRFEKSGDENLWRLVETGASGSKWCGVLCVYVDDLLFCGEEDVLKSSLQAVESQWSCAEAEWATSNKALKFCGIEITVDPNNDGLHLSQRGYEQEVLERWHVDHGAEFPHYKISEADFEATKEAIDPQVLKEAQALAGSLLWLATKTRPDLACGVSAMSRLMARNPEKALEVGRVLLSYIKANPGHLHYFKHFSNDGWGERSQLKAQRSQYSLEVFSDIAYAAGASHRSVQGVAVYFAGSPVAWQSSQQPFVTHSTAESELVSYCESLLIGRATEGLLCALWGVPLDHKNPFVKIIYGDNLAAIGLASGNTCSSWRTRHLRIRAAILKEALEEDNNFPGGVWRLLHLKGTELVADGLTKPLYGQAFSKFVQDLGLTVASSKQPVKPVESTCNVVQQHDGGGREAATMAMMAGSLLLSGMDAADDTANDADSTPLWVCGAMLMVFGAIMGQLTISATKCCLKRLHGPSSSSGEEDNRGSVRSEIDAGSEASVRIRRGKGSSSSNPSSTSLSIKMRSGTSMQRRDENSPGVSSQGSACSERGSHAAGGGGPNSSSLALDSGRAASSAMSRSSKTTSGSGRAVGAAESATSSSLPSASGSASAAVGAVPSVSEAQVPKELDLSNPWNKIRVVRRPKSADRHGQAPMKPPEVPATAPEVQQLCKAMRGSCKADEEALRKMSPVDQQGT
eukprot:s3180_g10.t1